MTEIDGLVILGALTLVVFIALALWLTVDIIKGLIDYIWNG